MTASDAILVFVGYLGIVIAVGVMYGDQAFASRQRQANASQRQIDRTIAWSLAAGTLIGIGAVVTLLIVESRTTHGQAMSPQGVVIWAMAQLVFVGIGIVFVVRRTRAVRRLNAFGPDHPLSRRTSLDLEASPDVVLG